MNPIPTRYKGYNFRSRTEARWAVYFDAIGCDWEYEPEGFILQDGSKYLPDFYLKSVGMWAEVKPGWPTDEEIKKAVMLSAGSGAEVLFLDGTPRQTNYWAVGACEFSHDPVVLGSGEELTGACWNDFYLSAQYLCEHRFYSSTGNDFGPDRPDDLCFGLDEPVNAGRSARFEFGESGRS